MDVRAQEKYIRISPKKARPVADLVRGKKAIASLTLLKFTPNKAAAIIAKAIKSAVANAENNHQLTKEDIIIKRITVDKGPMLKRARAGFKGSPTPILKRTSNITVVVSDQDDNRKDKDVKAIETKNKPTDGRERIENGTQG